MLEETELVKKLREIVWEADLCTTTAGIIRKKLEDHFGVDLSSKKQKRLINLQINSFLEEQLKTEALNEEVRGEAGEQKERKVETSEKMKEEGYRKMDVLKEEERGIGNGTKSCFQNLKDPSKGKETERQSKEVEEEDATSKSKKAVEQPYRAKEDEAPTKLKEREKQPNNIGEVVPSQSKDTAVQLISAGEEEIPSKPKKYKRERQDMEKSEKPRKKPKRMKVEEAPSKSKKPSKQPIQAEEAPKSDETEKQHKEGEEEALLKTKEKESQPQTGTEAKSPQNYKEQKRAGSAFLDPLPISDALVKFLGTDETALSRTEAVKKIWIHIKQKKLQDCSDKQKVICDDKLKELFQVESFSGFNVQKLLEPHFSQDGIV